MIFTPPKNTPLPSFQTEVGEPSQLIITDATMDLGGEYECLAITTIDEVSAATTVTILGRPGAPAGISVVVSELTANISWSSGLDNNSPITSYSVEGSTNHVPEWTILRNGNASDLNVRPLQLTSKRSFSPKAVD